MAKTKEQKKQELKSLQEKIKKQKTLMFVDFSGLKVEGMSELRKTLKKSDSEFKVGKKTLMKLALKEAGIEADIDKLEGEIALVLGYGDELQPVKLVYEFSKENPIKILGGFFEKQFKSAQDFIALAQLPSKPELLSRLIGSISSPVSGFVNVLEGNLKGLVYALSAIKK